MTSHLNNLESTLTSQLEALTAQSSTLATQSEVMMKLITWLESLEETYRSPDLQNILARLFGRTELLPRPLWPDNLGLVSCVETRT